MPTKPITSVAAVTKPPIPQPDQKVSTKTYAQACFTTVDTPPVEKQEEKKHQEQKPDIGSFLAFRVSNFLDYVSNAFLVVGPDSTTFQITADCHRSLLRKRENGNRKLLEIQDQSGAKICIANTRCISRTQDINLAQVIVRGTPKEREEAIKLLVAYQADCVARHHAS